MKLPSWEPVIAQNPHNAISVLLVETLLNFHQSHKNTWNWICRIWEREFKRHSWSSKGESGKWVIDLKRTPAHAFLGLKKLQWLPITYRIKSNLLSMIHKALQELTLIPTSCFICCHSHLVPCDTKAMENLHLLPTPASCHPQCLSNTHHSDSGLWTFGHNFSSACSALFNLLCHHPSWPSLAQYFILQDTSWFK